MPHRVPRHTVSASQISINHSVSKRRLQPILGLDEPLGIDPSTEDRYDQLFHNIAYQHGEALLTAPAAGRCVGAYGAGPAPAVLYGGGRRD